MYIMALFLLAALVVYVCTIDIESTVAMKWMTNTQDALVQDGLETRVFEGGIFGVSASDQTPRWIATKPENLLDSTTLLFQQTQLGKTYTLEIDDMHAPLWKDYVRHAKSWAVDCDTLFLIFGPVPDSNALYTVNLCIEENSYGQGLILPAKTTNKTLFSFTRSIDHIEKLTGIDFFSDLLDEESENYIESNHKRLRWTYPENFLLQRIQENKANLNGN